jgi:hypothetical protein
MSDRIDIRDKIVSLVEGMTDFSAANVKLYKLDRVDKTPSSSVYLGRMDSSVGSMGGGSNSIDRELVIMVDFHSDHGTDADAQTSAWLEELETAIYRARKAGEFPASVEAASLDFAEFRPTSTAQEKTGDLVSFWRVEFSERLATS